MTTTVEDMSLVDHACTIPVSDEHLWEITAQWVAGGLAAGERVVYFEDETAAAVLARLSDDRVPVRQAMEAGQFLIVPTEQTRSTLSAPSARLGELIAAQVDETAARGWPGLRLSGESGASLLRSGGVSGMLAYEEAIGQALRDHPTARLLCRFDRNRFDGAVIEAMRAIHDTELVCPVTYDDNLLRITSTALGAMRLAGEVDHTNHPQMRSLLDTSLDDVLRAPSASSDITLDLSSLRFLDVGGAVSLVHAAEEFPSSHRLVLRGVRPRVARVLDRCGAPFAAQLVLEHQLASGHQPRADAIPPE